MAVPTWAIAEPQHNKDEAVATINNGLMDDLPIRAKVLRGERMQAAVSKAAEASTLFFIVADTG